MGKPFEKMYFVQHNIKVSQASGKVPKKIKMVVSNKLKKQPGRQL